MCRSTQECASTNSKIYSNQICMESRTIATAQCMESVESGQFGRDSVRGLSLHFGCTNLFVVIPRTATHTHTLRHPYRHRPTSCTVVIENISVWRIHSNTPMYQHHRTKKYERNKQNMPHNARMSIQHKILFMYLFEWGTFTTYHSYTTCMYMYSVHNTSNVVYMGASM